MNKRAIRTDLLLLLTFCIGGGAFAAQRTGIALILSQVDIEAATRNLRCMVESRRRKG
ncbi:MAG: hypothetical protein LBD93_08220 [Treponema sp.]|nr:hypothetical protein [Treponema sp.]